MKIDIILAGVGGQGILSIATIVGAAAIKRGMYMKQAEVHGMSQRGGDVQSHFRLSDQPIASDLIPLGKADMMNYPDFDALKAELAKVQNCVAINADQIAKDLGSARSSNMVILGAASPYLQLPYEEIENAVRENFARKGEDIVNVNLACMKAGRELAEKK